MKAAGIGKFLKKGFLVVAGSAVLLVLAACDRPMEKAGRAVDDAGEKVKDAVK